MHNQAIAYDDQRPLRVLVVEDNPVFQQLICSAIKKYTQASLIFSFDTGSCALDMLQQTDVQFDLVLVDLGLPDMDGVEVIGQVAHYFPEIPIMVISTLASDHLVLAAIRAGAKGYFLKSNSSDSISVAICDVLNGNYPISPSLARILFKLAGFPGMQDLSSQSKSVHLSPRETETLRLISCGYSYKEVAEQMGVALSTVQYYVRIIYRKLDSNNQMQAVSKARDAGLI